MASNDEFPAELLTRKEAAKYLGLSPQTLANWAHTKSQTLPFIKPGRSVRYRKSDLEAWLDRRTVRPDDLNDPPSGESRFGNPFAG